MPTPPLQTTALNRALPRSWMVLLSSNFLRCAGNRPRTPSMCCGVLKPLAGGRSLSLEYSLQGGASMIRATVPDQQSLGSASKTLSSRMSCAVSPSRSKGSKQSRPRLMAADVTGLQTRRKGAALRLDATVSLMSLPGRACVALAKRWVRHGVRKARLASARRGARPAEAWPILRRSGLFHVCLLRSMAGCFCWQPTMAHTWAKGHWSLVQLPVW